MWNFMNDQPLKLKAPLHSNEIPLSEAEFLKGLIVIFHLPGAKPRGHTFICGLLSPFSEHRRPPRGSRVG